MFVKVLTSQNVVSGAVNSELKKITPLRVQSLKIVPEIEGIDLRPLERCEITTLKTVFVKINENFKQRKN